MDDDLPFYGRLAPCEERFWWNGTERTVTLRVLTEGEEAALEALVDERPEHERALAAVVERLAQALLEVDGAPVRARLPALCDRLAWIRQWPSSLLAAVLEAYVRAQGRPHAALLRLLEDPNYRERSLVRWRITKHCHLLAGRDLSAEEWAFAALHTARDLEEDAQLEWLRRQVHSHLSLLIQHNPQEAVKRLREDKKPGEQQTQSDEELLAQFLVTDTFFSDRRPLSSITGQVPPWRVARDGHTQPPDMHRADG